MFIRLYRLLVILSFLLHLLAVNAQSTYSYPSSSEDFLNPERGFYYPSNSQDGPLTQSWVANRRSNYTATGANYQVKSSLFFRYFMLSDFLTSAISTSYLQSMEQDFEAIRAAGSKVIIRFSYTNTYTPTPPYGDATKSQVLSHIAQLSPLLQDHADIIAAVQLGFIGTWGEGYYTDNFGDAATIGYLTATDWLNRNEVVQALLDALPEDRMLQVRYPQQKQKFVYGPTAPTNSASSGGRIGFHNDCFLASDYDFGTYTNYDPWSANHPNMLSELRTYMAADAERVAVGGETCYLNEDTPLDIQCAANGGRADSDLELFNWSYLNSDYLNTVNNTWNGTCLDDIKRRLGYRFELTSGTFTDVAQPGQAVQFDLSVRNIGYAPPFNPRDAEYVLRNTASGQLFFASLTADPQNWLAGTTNDLDQSFCLPVDMPLGTYELLLHLPDPYDNLYGNPDYSIRLASQLPNNTESWEATTGYNKLGHTLTVNTTASASACAGETTFSTISLLPVDWDFFRAFTPTPGLVQLRWATTDEEQNAGFEVQRSTDGRYFTKLAWMPAKTSAPYTYAYQDTDLPQLSTLYYRLKQVDHDGRSSYSLIERVTLKMSSTSLSISPNPSNGFFVVDAGLREEMSLDIFRLDGQLSWSGRHDFSVGHRSLSLNLPAGSYLLVATGKTDRLVSRLFIH